MNCLVVLLRGSSFFTYAASVDAMFMTVDINNSRSDKTGQNGDGSILSSSYLRVPAHRSASPLLRPGGDLARWRTKL
jgi:hypothetical protein